MEMKNLKNIYFKQKCFFMIKKSFLDLKFVNIIYLAYFQVIKRVTKVSGQKRTGRNNVFLTLASRNL